MEFIVQLSQTRAPQRDPNVMMVVSLCSVLLGSVRLSLATMNERQCALCATLNRFEETFEKTVVVVAVVVEWLAND